MTDEQRTVVTNAPVKLAKSAGKLEESAQVQTDSADRRTELAADRTVRAAERTYAAWVRTGSPFWRQMITFIDPCLLAHSLRFMRSGGSNPISCHQ